MRKLVVVFNLDDVNFTHRMKNQAHLGLTKTWCTTNPNQDKQGRLKKKNGRYNMTIKGVARI